MTALVPGRGRAHGARFRLLAAAAAACVGGGACVDTSARKKPGAGGPLCEAAAPVAYTGPAAIPSVDTSTPGPSVWKNAVIKGGGFVSGVSTSPIMPGLVFARTDVGGAYRYDPPNHRWMPITDWAGHNDANLTGVESIAPDPVDPNRVYMAAGQYLTAGNGWILSSTDMGQTWERHAIGAPMGGNADGRSMGERLAVDPNDPRILYFASRNAGLWKSTDTAQTWTRVADFPATGATSDDGTPAWGLTFVLFDPRAGTPGAATSTIYVGVGVKKGVALYRTTDASAGGATWEAVPGQPDGLMPHHGVLDGCGNVYLAYNDMPGPNGITAGAVWRFSPADGAWKNVSPPVSGGGGFGGISADAGHPGTLLVTTMDRWGTPEIYRTVNGGDAWTPIGTRALRDVAGAQWLWWHGSNLPAAGWMGDVDIDPFDPNRAFTITGQGIWSTGDLTESDRNAPSHWRFDNDGLEETVALDVASPPAGPPLLSAVGDIAGFRHDDLDVSPPGGMFDNPIFGNTNSLDFAEAAPAIVARVGTNATMGGARGASSTDGGATWTPFAGTPGANASAGTIAVSADGATFVWAAQRLAPALSRDRGATWTPCAGLPAGARVAADRVNPARFYASGRNAAGRNVMYVSGDGGATFTETAEAASGRPRPAFGVEGDVWVATSAGLLHSQDGGVTYPPVVQVTSATAVGFGMAAPGQSAPAVFVAGAIANTWGIYRSDDRGVTWQRVDDPQHQFGYINCLAGDPRRYGRVYLGTAGRGIVYGDPR